MKNQNKSYSNILIFGRSNIGDICYDLAIIAPLRERFPTARITCVTSPGSVEVCRAIKGVDRVIQFNKHSGRGRIREYCGLIAALRSENFDLAIFLRNTCVRFFLGIPVVLTAAKLSPRSSLHIAERNLNLLRFLAIKPEKSRLELALNRPRMAEDSSNGLLRIGILPLAAWKLKCWPGEKWKELIDHLTSKLNAKVFIFGKTDGSEWEQRLLKKLPESVVCLVDKTSLLETLSWINEMDIFIGNDSSLVHFSSCMGIPTIGLYGPSNFQNMYPLFHRHFGVLTRFRADCVPCHFGRRQPGTCKKTGEPADCMWEVSVRDVLEKVRAILFTRDISRGLEEIVNKVQALEDRSRLFHLNRNLDAAMEQEAENQNSVSPAVVKMVLVRINAAAERLKQLIPVIGQTDPGSPVALKALSTQVEECGREIQELTRFIRLMPDKENDEAGGEKERKDSCLLNLETHIDSLRRNISRLNSLAEQFHSDLQNAF